MEKPFLPFNDYLGLSSIFKQNEVKESSPTVEDTSKKVTKTVSDAWIDKRIEEILHQYSLKKSLSNSQRVNSSEIATNVNAYLQNNFNSASVDHPALQNSKNRFVACTNSKGSLTSFSSPTQMTKVNSLTSSPITPEVGSWLNAAATTSAGKLQAANGPTSLLTHTTSDPLHFGTSDFPKVTSADLSASLLVPASSYVNDVSQAVALPSINRSNRRNTLGCSFCRNNKEVDDWVLSHQLKDSLNRVMCPILRSYVCPLCFASGDNAHTLGHCPLNPDKKNSSLPLAVRRRTNATGRVKL